MNYQPLKYIYRPSANPDAYTLLLLHGTGGDEQDLLPIGKQMGNKFNLLGVRGNVSEQGMPRFFRRLGMGVFDEADLKFRAKELVHFVKEIADKEKFNSSKVIALGFSNGANIAGAIILQDPAFFAGVVMLRPMQPFKNPAPVTNHTHTPVFISSGSADPTVDVADNNAYIALLKQAGFEVSDHLLPAGHNLTQQDLQLVHDWFSDKFA